MKCCGVAAGRSGRNLEILKAKTSLCCTSLWTQLPHQEDHQSSCRDYATLCTDPNSVNMYESKYGALSDSPLVTVQGMISPNEPLVWSVQLQKRLQSQKRGGQFASYPPPHTPHPASPFTPHWTHSQDLWRRTPKETKRQCLVLVDLVEKRRGLWRGTLEVPLWQASSLSNISRVPANPARRRGGTRTPRSTRPGGTKWGEGCALAKGPLIISQAQSFRDPH